MKKSFFTYKFLHICLAFSLLASCSTKKAGFTNKLYHNTTAHYNVWWNGNETMKEVLKALDNDVKDDYSHILPVYKLGTSQDALKLAPQLDRVFEKGTKGIKKHSINIKGKEHIHYVAHCYLLVIKSQFYKQEYATAAVTAQYFISQFKDTKEAYEGMIWYARSLAYQKEYSSAETVLDKIKTDLLDKKAFVSLEAQLYPAYAECALLQEKYKIAADHIKTSIEVVKNKSFKTRLYFILGQMYQSQEKLSTASKYYEMSMKGNSDYSMRFNARMNIAVCFTEKAGNNEEVIRILEKMLKDKNNQEFQDQIYYAIGEVYMATKDAESACNNWEKSVSAATNNKPQKIKSSLRLAETYADLFQDYVESYKYYDTAILTMHPEGKEYTRIYDKYKVIKSLADHISIVERADSLLLYADMPAEERDKMIDEVIEELKEREEEAKQAELISTVNAAIKEQGNTLKGNWYFYNENTLRQGKESFKKMFGNRVLEDYWFMSKKQSVSSSIPTPPAQSANEEEEEEGSYAENKEKEEVVADTNGNENDPHSRAYYLKDIPKTEEEKEELHQQIVKSLLLLGFIFDEGIQNEEKALASLHRLIDDYQGSEYSLPAFYQLYKIYERNGNTPNANYYRNVLLKGFPESDYANILRDKDYYLEILARDKQAENAYNEIFKAYQRKAYEEVVILSNEAVEKYNDLNLKPKYMYWKALALGKIGEKGSMFMELDSIVKAYPKSEIIPIIENQLAFFKTDKAKLFFEDSGLADTLSLSEAPLLVNDPDLTITESIIDEKFPSNKGNDLPPESELYRYKDNIDHLVVIIADDKKINATQLSYAISDFNNIYFSMANLRTKVLLFSKNMEMVSIEQFPNAKKALEYYTFLQQPASPLQEFDSEDYTILVVSIQNYMPFYNNKNIEAYTKFFRKFYF